jgi:hypothetical protein
MAAINLRQDKERPLTIQEVDDNFFLINQEVGQKLDTSSFTAVSILSLLEDNGGAGSGLDADFVHGRAPAAAATANTVVLRDALGNITTSNFIGNLLGNVVGNLTGNVTGTLTGNSSNVDGIVQIEHGGTGGATASAARTNLGLGSVSTQAANNVNITGGSITGITDLAVADGGTGAGTASGARSNLGVAIGLDVQAYSATLTNLAGTSGDGFLIRLANNTSVVRTLAVGNSLELTNANGTGGNPTISLTLSPTVSSIQKTGTNGSGDIGQTGNRFNVIYGKATSAQYADLAEKYTTDSQYEAGTVMVVAVAGEAEATASFQSGQRVIGVISTAPAHIMNDVIEGQAIGLVGRVPVKVVGPIRKGQTIISNQDGKAIVGDGPNVFGQALETNLEAGVKLVECFIK